MTEAQRFCARAAIAFMIVVVAIYVGAAFVSLDLAFWRWGENTRYAVAGFIGFIGAPVAFLAGMSAVDGC